MGRNSAELRCQRSQLINLCFAIPLAAFGAEHLSGAKFLMNLVPSYIPWRLLMPQSQNAPAMSLSPWRPLRIPHFPKPADRASVGALQPNCVSTLVPRRCPQICGLVLVKRRRHSPFRCPKERCLLRIFFHFGGDKPSRDARRGSGFHSWQYCAATTLGHIDR